MNKNRRIILGGMAWSLLSAPIPRFLPSTERRHFIVDFLWKYPKKMSRDEADSLQAHFVDCDGIWKLNQKYIDRGLLFGTDHLYFEDHMLFRYHFSSALAYVQWGVEKESLKLVRETGEFKIITKI